jgi:hypothetical protein
MKDASSKYTRIKILVFKLLTNFISKEKWRVPIDHFHLAKSSINVLRQCCNPPFVVQLLIFFKVKIGKKLWGTVSLTN